MTHVLDILKSQPTYDQLCVTLTEWTKDPVISKLTVKDASIARVLVNEIIPTYWPLAEADEPLRVLLTRSLSSLAGISALLNSRLNTDCLDILQLVVASDDLSPTSVFAAFFGDSQERQEPDAKAQALWTQYVNFVAGSKVLAAAAQAALSKDISRPISPGFWLHDLKAFLQFLARQVSSALALSDSIDERVLISLAPFLDRSVSLELSPVFLSSLIHEKLRSDSYLRNMASLLKLCSNNTQSRVISGMFLYLQSKYLPHSPSRSSLERFQRDADRVGAVASVLQHFAVPALLKYFQNALTLSSGTYTLATRRALVLTLGDESRSIIVEKCLARWADQLYIKHASTVDQEAITETILLTCAYINARHLSTITKSKSFVEGISNHLESTSDRIRFLGMILAETISAQIIADEKKRLTFGVPDTQTEEAKWWRSLIEMEDRMKSSEYLEAGLVDIPLEPADQSDIPHGQGLQISEILEDDMFESSDDDEFKPMRVPDSDDEDSDEDPTLVDRERLRPPVYIRDLIKMLNNRESYKHVSTALKTAPSLIRRKAGFGTEVEDYAINLVQLFAGMRDDFDMDDFQELRQEALKALVVVCPTITCPYLTETFFTGDYSLQQRIIILSAIGLGSRELAGAIKTAPQFQNLTVSKTLPLAIRHHYESVTTVASAIQDDLLRPLAIEAIDALSGPAALKVQKTTRRSRTPKTTPTTANRLTPIVANHILFPLLGRFQIHAGKMIDRDASAFYEANLLAYYLRTISLVFQCSSTSPALNRLTTEYWSLILSLRSQTDKEVMSALLFGVMVIIDVNDDRTLATTCARQLIETQEWCSELFQRVAEDKVREVVAGTLLKIREIVEKHQMLMMSSTLAIGNIGRGKFGIAGLK